MATETERDASRRDSPSGLLATYGLVAGAALVGIAVVAGLAGVRAFDPIVVTSPLVFVVGTAGFGLMGAWAARMLRAVARDDVAGFALGAFVVPVAGAVFLARALAVVPFAAPGAWAVNLFGMLVTVLFVGYLQGRAPRPLRPVPVES